MIMCTAVSWHGPEHYFGRNLDVECAYGEQIVVTPRRFAWPFCHQPTPVQAYAMIGTAVMADGVPLYFDATNEKGLSMAGLRFAGNAHYRPAVDGSTNVASFEIIPWLLTRCASVGEAVALLGSVCITDDCFSASLPFSPLHWMLADADRSVTVEQTKAGLAVMENPVGVLTNNPPFERQLDKLNDYLSLSPHDPVNRFAPDLPLATYSRGMGAIGLPGDFSSSSRFVRAAFVRAHIAQQADGIGQFFRILDAVVQPLGCVILPDGRQEYTAYSSCCDTARGIYYYKTYENSGIIGVDMYQEDLDADVPAVYSFKRTREIMWQNQKP